MKLTAAPFTDIREGRKVIESRLFDEKRQTIAIGDTIVFTNADTPIEQVATKVIGLLRYRTFSELFADHNPALFGGTSKEQLTDQIKQFYSDEEESKYGVLGIRLQRID